ncbi:hypothetical protein PR003_g29709 [Phytophthora rubi]|uniref:Uncharacterized protein n=1 Tax=Phytophthora rubi TaxID=129364 RepID=A0A6A3H5H9_9STRA|nr:hypothetical protein PR002_g28938 [Phytophthora rubi]KAE9274104.1 hypothetical protein PR003_g29709 [Phytophthora rubi]
MKIVFCIARVVLLPHVPSRCRTTTTTSSSGSIVGKADEAGDSARCNTQRNFILDQLSHFRHTK